MICCEAIDLGIIPDCPETLKTTFEKAQTLADVVVTSGGVSVGEADYTKDILEQLGEIGFWISDAWACQTRRKPQR